MTQHLVLTSHVEVAGDEARGTTAFHKPNEATIDGEPWIFTVGGTHHDRLVRTGGGWRIARRVEETRWREHPMPGLAATPPPLAVPLDL